MNQRMNNRISKTHFNYSQSLSLSGNQSLLAHPLPLKKRKTNPIHIEGGSLSQRVHPENKKVF